MKPVIFLLWMLIIASVSSGQQLYKPLLSSYAGLGAYSLHFTDLFSFTTNPAALAQLQQPAAGMYAERRFLLSALNHYNAAVAITTSSGNVALRGSYYGFSDYNESGLGLAYARKLGKNADAGVQFNYSAIGIAGYGNASAIGFDLGAVFHLSDILHAGMCVSNPIGGKFGKQRDEKLPAVYSTGLGYEASSQVLVCVEISKEEDQPVNINAGIHYQLSPQFLVRIGVATATSSIWAGTGFLWKMMRIDIMTSYHPQLGITPGLLLLFNFKKGNE